MAARLLALKQEQMDLQVEARTILDAAQAAGNRDLSPAERTSLDKIEARLTALRPELEREMRFQDVQRTAPDVLTGGSDPGAVAQPARGRRFAEMFPHAALDAGGFRSEDEFLALLHAGLNDPRLRSAITPGLLATATGTVPSDGGFSVPTQFAARWLDESLEDEIVRPRADVYGMTGRDLHVPGFDSSDHSGAVLYGGIAGAWIAEGSEITPSTPKLRLIELMARKLGVLAQVSNELLADGVGYADQLGRAIVKAIGWYLDDGFLNGVGAPGPLGVLKSPCLITVDAEVGQPATVVYMNLVKMFARLHPQSVKNAVWVCSQTVIPYLSVLSVNVGTGGSWIPVMSESDGTFKILTRPVIFTEHLPSVGNAGDVLLADFLGGYAVGLRSDVSLDRSAHPGFTRDTTYYRGLLRGDGQPKWSAPMTLKDGTTVSPFVTLAART